MPKLITGCNGFIGKKFAEKHQPFIGMEDFNCWAMLEFFKGWEDIDEIIHMGAISSTTETNEEALNSYNVEFSIRLFEKVYWSMVSLSSMHHLLLSMETSMMVAWIH